jgi:hypothetical protein
MWLEPPSKPSADTEQALRDLINYYRQLVVYHQQSAAMAASQLANLETLLSPQLSAHSSWQSPPPPSFSQNHPAEFIAQLEPSFASLPEKSLSITEDLTPYVKQILQVNRSKILRLDYLVLEIAERLFIAKQQYPELKQQLKQTLERGEKQNLWSSIPDSPDCWTLDLKDFPDLLPKYSAKSGKKSKKSGRTYNRSRLPNTGRMKEFETLTSAISTCLKEHSPKLMDAHQIMDWIYPDPLPEKIRGKAYQAISDGLNKGCSRNRWQRAEIGWYFWEEN